MLLKIWLLEINFFGFSRFIDFLIVQGSYIKRNTYIYVHTHIYVELVDQNSEGMEQIFMEMWE